MVGATERQKKGQRQCGGRNQGSQEMSARKGLFPISDKIAPTLDGSKDKDSENGIIHHRHRETTRRLHHLPIKRNKQLAFDGMGMKETVKV